MSDLRLLLVDDHHVVRLGLRALLEGEPGLTVVGEAGTAAEALQAAERAQPDIVLRISACQIKAALRPASRSAGAGRRFRC